MKNNKELEFNMAKKEMIKAIHKFQTMLEKNDISFIDNYPKYLPSFDEFLCDMFDIEYSELND